MSAKRRAGFSLIEVLLATAILMGAIVVLGQLTGIGYRNAAAARDEVTAQLLCESKLNEILSGIAPVQDVAEAPIVPHRGWLYRIAVRPLEHPNLVALEVAVRQDLPPEKRPVEARLVRWLFRAAQTAPGAMPVSDPSAVPTSTPPADFTRQGASLP